MIWWDMMVVFVILAFSYALAFRQDVPFVVTRRAFMFFILMFVVLNIVPILDYLGSVVHRIIFGG